MKIDDMDFCAPEYSQPVKSNLDRFGFEVLPAAAAHLDDDSLSGINIFKAVLALVIIAALWAFGLMLYKWMESYSYAAALGKSIESHSAASEVWALSPLVCEPVIEPGLETEAKPEPSQQPRKRLVNPGGTMRASFPMPPDSPPKDSYVPGREIPAGRPQARALAGFDPDREAYDPSAESALAGRNSTSVHHLAAPRAHIGEYEVFDPERDLKAGDWEIFYGSRP